MEGGGQFGGTPTSAPPRMLILHSPREEAFFLHFFDAFGGVNPLFVTEQCPGKGILGVGVSTCEASPPPACGLPPSPLAWRGE